MIHKTFYDSAIYLYMFLLVGSCVLTLYPAFGPITVAFIALLWGMLATGITLWMLERVHDYQKTVKPPQAGGRLPDALIYKMRRQDRYSRGVRATKAFSAHNIFLITALLMYLTWAVCVTLQPVIPDALRDLNNQILSVFRMDDGFDAVSYNLIPLGDVLMRNILPIFVLVIAYWLGQVFGYSSRAGEVLVWLCFGLFVIYTALHFTFVSPVAKNSLADIWYGYGWGRSSVLQSVEVIPSGGVSALQRRLYTLGMPGVILGYLPGVIVSLVLLRNAFTKASAKIKVAAGLLVLLALLALDICYPVGAGAFGLHLAGWSALAFLSIRGRTDVRKIYRLYQ